MMFKGIFGGRQEGKEESKGKPDDNPATIGDIFYDAAVEAAQRDAAQGNLGPNSTVPQPQREFPAIDSDVFLNEDPGTQRPAGQPHQPGQPHVSGQAQGGFQQQPQQQQQQFQQPAQQPQVFIPQGYQTPSQLRSKYERLKENRNKIAARLRAASESDPTKNPYATQGANGQVTFDQNRHNRDQLDYSAIDSDMREVWSQITEAERSAGEVTDQVRRAANQYFQQQFAGRKASQELQRLTGTLFARHVTQLIRSGFLLNPDNLTSQVLDSHFRNVFYAALGEATAQTGANLGPQGSGRPFGQAESDPERQDQDDPYADWPEESRKLMAAFHRSQGTKPKTLAEQARLEREKQNPPQQQNGGNR